VLDEDLMGLRELNRRSRRWMDTWGLLIACVVFVVVSAFGLPSALAANRDEGTFGTFTAAEKSCDRSGCGWTGTFVSDDGRVVDRDAIFDADQLERSGDTARAQTVPGDESLYAPGSNDWLLYVLGSVGCLGYVGWWVWARRWRGSRREQAAARTVTPGRST
jgi:hypothetical protein